ncbi:Dyp-type peroxidase [Rhodococcus sp. NPDC003318]|uniref:Dyp-type peroxidase n=1 Tax=Rhodococcus sp. NPDC003318 TaxID=3364503 RepID=UPI003698B768
MTEPRPAAPAPQPQPVIGEQSPAAIFLVAAITEGGDPVTRQVLADASGLARSVALRVPGAGLELVVAVGSDAWDRLFPGPRPAQLRPFREVRGARHVAPATPGDLLFHIRAMSHDACFELAHRITQRLAGAATVVEEVHGFRYLESRDLIGFVDGTGNPTGRAALAAVTVGDEDPPFAGGSYVHVQRYVHDLAAWEALPVAEQERVVGRTKPDDTEMPPAVRPANSHTALTSITDADGTDLEIVRANLAYGRAGGEKGTYFIGYSRDPAVTERMLRNMVVGDPPGNHDRLLDFSTAVTGTAFFAPSATFLERPPSPGQCPGSTQAVSRPST